ncbi:MAG: T9SS type A sorting domain-containing protein [Chitinophagaceae bacterium]|nr:T9SS type A sorting domain-containing protein [Chitinophagaceae bacterium]
MPYSGSAPDMGYAEFASGGPVPIKLVDLAVREVNAKNQLDWTTATESNSSHFNIERSSNAQSYQTIGRVNASGFSTTDIRYSFTDVAPLNGINYYRLAMIDKDVTLEYSKTVSITNKGNNATAIIYADLSAGTNAAKIVITSATNQTVGLTIIDASGRTILNYGITLQKGSNTINKSIPGLAKGIYYIRLFAPGETVVKNSFAHD